MKSHVPPFLTLAANALGQSVLTAHTPANAVTCQELLLSWSGGTAPYIPAIISGDGNVNKRLADLGFQEGTSAAWLVNQPAGSFLELIVQDEGGSFALSAHFNVNQGPDMSCVGKPPALASSPLSPVETISPAPVRTNSTTTPSASSSTTGSTQSTNTTPSEPDSTTVDMNIPNTSKSGTSTSIGSIVASVIGGCATVLCAILLLRFWVRQAKKAMPRPLLQPFNQKTVIFQAHMASNAVASATNQTPYRSNPQTLRLQCQPSPARATVSSTAIAFPSPDNSHFLQSPTGSRSQPAPIHEAAESPTVLRVRRAEMRRELPEEIDAGPWLAEDERRQTQPPSYENIMFGNLP